MKTDCTLKKPAFRRSLRWMAITIAAFAGLSTGISAAQPNILIITATDLGWMDTGFQGGDVRTPHLDALAKDSLQVERFYVHSMSTPTRAAALTGRYPHRYVLQQLDIGIAPPVLPPWREHGLPARAQTLPGALGELGYANRALVGSWNLGHARQSHHPLNHGFTHFYGSYNGEVDYLTQQVDGERDWHDGWIPSGDRGYSTTLIGERSVHWIRKFVPQGPFFMQVAFQAPRTPLEALDEDIRRYRAQGLHGRISNDERNRLTYQAMVTAMDREIGRILAELKATGQHENTIVMFFSACGGDFRHGADLGSMRGRKQQPWEGGVRVPMLISWPAKLQPHKSPQVMAAIDIFPTLMGAIGSNTVPPEGGFDGINLWQSLAGKAEPVYRRIYLGQNSMVGTDWKIVNEHLTRIDMDPHETTNLGSAFREIWHEFHLEILKLEALKPRPMPPFGRDRGNFSPRSNWDMRQAPQ